MSISMGSKDKQKQLVQTSLKLIRVEIGDTNRNVYGCLTCKLIFMGEGEILSLLMNFEKFNAIMIIFIIPINSQLNILCSN